MPKRPVGAEPLVRQAFMSTAKVDTEFQTMADEFGMAKTQLLAMACKLGLDQLKRAVYPERYIPPEAWERVVDRLKKASLKRHFRKWLKKPITHNQPLKTQNPPTKFRRRVAGFRFPI